MEERQKFYDLYKKGIVPADKVDAYIEEWHTGTSEETLRDYLGMSELTEEEYSAFVLLNRLPKKV